MQTNNIENIKKFSYIRKLPSGKYRVFSEKGKNLGTFDTKEQAKKRLRQIEFFKHKKASIDLSNIDKPSLSAVMRELNKKDVNLAKEFLTIYKNYFDQFIVEDIEKATDLALANALKDFGKTNDIKINKKLIKNAVSAELGNPAMVGEYLAGIIRFTLNRIKPENRQSAINKVKLKIYNLNEMELGNKKMPAPASMGQSITFVKHVLFNQNPVYIRKVLNEIVRNL